MSQSNPSEYLSPVTTVILAGGLGKRIGGDKGLQVLHGKTLMAWVLDAIRAESDEILINVNNDNHAYQAYGFPLIADQLPGWLGPLAGLQSALLSASHDFVMTVPCDTPYLPRGLINKLQLAQRRQNSEAAVVLVAGRRQPAIALYRKSVLPKLTAYLGGGGRKVNDWLGSLQLSVVNFDNEDEFGNINTQEDLLRANKMPVYAHKLNSSGNHKIVLEKLQ